MRDVTWGKAQCKVDTTRRLAYPSHRQYRCSQHTRSIGDRAWAVLRRVAAHAVRHGRSMALLSTTPTRKSLRTFAWLAIVTMGGATAPNSAETVPSNNVWHSDTTAHNADASLGSGAPLPLYSTPVSPVIVARLFDPPPQPWNAGHRGIDLVSEPGHEVRSPGAGVVTFAGTVVDRGVITVRHSNGLRSSLEPVNPIVEEGDIVEAHQAVGYVESTSAHCAPSHCVHWGLRDGERYLNPLDWLVGFGPVRLLPMREPGPFADIEQATEMPPSSRATRAVSSPRQSGSARHAIPSLRGFRLSARA
jgi:murein DD-endopeptidase MepM/ murein hydrolase activator NlpD